MSDRFARDPRGTGFADQTSGTGAVLHTKTSAAFDDGRDADVRRVASHAVNGIRFRPEPIVLIASPLPRLRRRWREGVQGFATAEVSQYPELLRSLAEREAAVVLLDLHLPELGGMDGVGDLQRLRPAARIVVLAPRPDEKEGIAALKLGARGYCDRAIAPVLIGKAVVAVQNGEIWIGRKLTSHLLDELTSLAEARLEANGDAQARARLHLLTPRERSVIDLLGAGATNKDIARALTITERTVKAHLTAVFRKLGISGRLQAALLAIEQPLAAHHELRCGLPAAAPLPDGAGLSGSSG
jgi:DNA-binding NarL/FixJ family response regulator